MTKGWIHSLPVFTNVTITLTNCTYLELGLVFPFSSSQEDAIPPKCPNRTCNSVISPFCPSAWPEFKLKVSLCKVEQVFNSSSFLPCNTFQPWSFGFEGLKGRVSGMWRLLGLLFYTCFNVQGQVRILLSNFYKLYITHPCRKQGKEKLLHSAWEKGNDI